jgi:hypothetical protein
MWMGRSIARFYLKIYSPQLSKRRACPLAGSWDLGVYLSEIGKLDAKPETKQRLKYALNPKNAQGWPRLQVEA